MLMETTPGYIIHFSIMTCLKYTITPVDAAVGFPSTAVHYAVDQSVPRGSIRKTKHMFCFSASLRLTPMSDLARKADYFHSQFSKYRKPIKNPINLFKPSGSVHQHV
jgi:hypothetical protein